MYSLIVGKNILSICENSGIMSFYSCTYGSLLDEEPRKAKPDKTAKSVEKSSDKAASEETKTESDSGKGGS